MTTAKSASIGSTFPNPVGSTSEFLPNYLSRVHGINEKDGFDHQKTSVFVPGFDPLEFERRCTLLLAGVRVCSRPIPASKKSNVDGEQNREYSLFYSTKEGNLPVTVLGGTAHE